MIRVLCVIVGYCFGMIQTAFILGKLKGIDIREHGSGNSGTTNALRVMGKKAGAICFVMDAVKAIVPMAAVYFLFRNGTYAQIEPLLRMYVGVGVVLGHNFPFYMGFKGGKGIMATGGISVGMGLWSFLGVAGTFFLTFFITHYVSLGSLLMYIAFVVVMIVEGQMGMLHMSSAHCMELYIIAILMMMMAFYRHRGNIDRLIHGNERKTYLTKKNMLDTPDQETVDAEK
ncbi:MAG: glycerol-3-phosphate 1-O-acyltransferase PlsY [Lachnospiraceae bacterium]|nr:glycerol-3-phosphate 1-O-acyltransferase PlsY [Lachnospiraceae bacterium]